MRKFCILFLFLFITFFTYSQDIPAISNDLLKLKDKKSISAWFEKNRTMIDTDFIFSLINQAYMIWYSEGRKDDGLHLCDISRQIAEKNKDKDSAAYAIFQKGVINYYTYDYKNAKPLINESLKIFMDAGNAIGEANCYKMNGDIVFSEGDFTSAIDFYDKALQIYIEAKSYAGEIAVYYSLAECYYYNNDFEKAGEFYDIALKYYTVSKDDIMIAGCRMKKGYIAFYTGDNANADLLLDEALASYKKYDNKTGMASCYKGKADILSSQSKYPKAEELYDTALELYKKTGEAIGEANCYKYKADIAQITGYNDRAKELYTQALNIYLKMNDYLDQGNCYQKLGELSSHTGNDEKALEFLEKALSIYKKINAVNGIAASYLILGNIYSNSGENVTSEDYYNKALELYLNSKSLHGEGLSYLALGQLFTTYGNKMKASEYYEKALILFNKTNFHIGEIECYSVQADIALFNNDFYTAKELYEKSLILSQNINYPLGLANCYERLGTILFINSKNNEALDYYNKALKINIEIGKTNGIANCYELLGDMEFQSENYKTAKNFYDKAISLFKKSGALLSEANCNQKIGYLLSLTNRDMADIIYQRSLNVILKSDDPSSISMSYYYLAYNNFVKDNIIKLKKGSENIAQSILWLEKERTGAGSSEQKKSFFSGNYDAYKLGIDIHYYLKDYNTMFRYMESSRARSLLDEMSEYAVLQSDEIEKNMISGLKEIKAKINAIINIISLSKKENKSIEESQRLLFNLNLEYNKLFDTILSKYPKYRNIVKSDIITLDKTREMLKKDEVIIEYSLGNPLYKDCFAFIITKEEYTVLTIPVNVDTISDDIEIFRELIISPESVYILKNNNIERLGGSNEKNGVKINAEKASAIMNKRLYSSLIEPLLSLLKNHNDIVIIPDDKLSILPFDVLKNNDGKYLAEIINISYIQSSSILSISRKMSPTPKLPFLGFGGAVYEVSAPSHKKKNVVTSEIDKIYFSQAFKNLMEDRSSLSDIYDKKGYYWIDLPGTDSEVKNIGDLFYKKGSSDYANNIITGDKVNEIQIKEMNNLKLFKNYRIIHFATHGIADLEIPELSSIVLSIPGTAKNANNDGYLTMNEILNLQLDCELVTLSACETGLGKLIAGEGLIGLTQSFILAGSKNVNVSLWSVNDESTSIFMLRFYEKLKKGISYKDALTQTKREFIKDKSFQNPFYWAPFIIYGSN